MRIQTCRSLIILLAAAFVSCTLAFGVSAQEKKAAEPFTLKITTDKPDALYKKGDKIKFLVSLFDEKEQPVAGKKISISLEKEIEPPQNSSIESKGTPVEIETSFDRPGFLLCRASFEYESGKSIKGLAGAGVSPLEIKCEEPAPPDFKEFWDKKKEELAKIPMNPKLEPVKHSNNKLECFDIKLDCIDGVPVSGCYARPAGAAPKSLPAILTLHSAGIRGASMPISMADKGMLALDINAHGIENGKPPAYYGELGSGKLKNYWTINSDNKDKFYFVGMYLRVVRALEFLKAQPEWDGKNLVVWGGSQGGMQALVGAALDPQVNFCVSMMPGGCNLSGRKHNQKSGWPALKKEEEKVVIYFDVANFAPYIKAQTVVRIGFIDTTCPPTTIYAAYNNIASPKEVINYPLMGHLHYYEDTTAKLDAYLKKIKEESK